MALNLDTLTLWEIAFRWHNLDPYQYPNTEGIPLHVKDTIRFLAAEVYYERLYSKLLIERESLSQETFYKRKWIFFKEKYKFSVEDYADEFLACIKDNVLDQTFLKSVYIPFWELEYWSKEYHIPFPTFWVKPYDFGGNKIPIGDELIRVCTEEGKSEQNGDLQTPPAEAADTVETSEDLSQQQEAAYARHKPIHDLKRDCIQYWLTHQKFSNKEAARRFYESLPELRKKSLVESNATRTLAQAISDYKNRDKLQEQGKLPHWLNGFNPELPQT